MNIRQQYTVERIIINIYNSNKDKSLNEIKKMIKEQIKSRINEETASKVGTDKIIEVVIKNRKEENKLSVCSNNRKVKKEKEER